MGFKKLTKTKYNNILFTTPSHSQRCCITKKLRALYKFDVSETDTHSPEDMLKDSENYVSNIYGVKKTKFLTNGSSSGIIISVLSVVNKDDNVLLWDNAHRCHKNAVKLAGANPIYYQLPTNDFGVYIPKYHDIEQYFTKYKIKALIITSPTYEGYVSDVKKIKDLCDKYNTYLIVDEAHGALYPFSEELPESAIKYADFVVQSLHKTAGGLNPTALLHCNIDVDIEDAFNMISTTSPSYPLLMSIENNVSFLASKRGEKAISSLINNIKEFRKLDCVEFAMNDDITKILIKKKGYTGDELSDFLYKNRIEDEKTNDVSTMLLTGIGTKKNKLEKLKLVLKKL